LGYPETVIIIAGTLRVDPADRDRYLRAVAPATKMARQAPGCLDFAQSPDPIEPDRINIFERWESDKHLVTFRALPGDTEVTVPPLLGAEVRKYRIEAVEAP